MKAKKKRFKKCFLFSVAFGFILLKKHTRCFQVIKIHQDPNATAIERTPAYADSPLGSYTQQILEKVASNRVTVIVAPTGCGKSTGAMAVGKGSGNLWRLAQHWMCVNVHPFFSMVDTIVMLFTSIKLFKFPSEGLMFQDLRTRNSCNFFHVWIASIRNFPGIPQMLLDENEERSILVTQPRRVAATSLARRVAQQRGVTLGTEVGFKIGGLVVAMEGVRSLGSICSIQIHFSESSYLNVSCLLLQMDSISKIEGFMTMELKTVSHQPRRCHHVSHFCAGCSEVSRSGRTKLTFATTAIAMIQCIQVGMVVTGD